MPNKTIYVSQEDEPLFEEARQIAGESLSAVIVLALREFVSRQKEKEKSMKEITVLVGPKESSREQRFIGMQVGKWKGVDDRPDMDAGSSGLPDTEEELGGSGYTNR